jgi:hypothetical protein
MLVRVWSMAEVVLFTYRPRPQLLLSKRVRRMGWRNLPEMQAVISGPLAWEW